MTVYDWYSLFQWLSLVAGAFAFASLAGTVLYGLRANKASSLQIAELQQQSAEARKEAEQIKANAAKARQESDGRIAALTTQGEGFRLDIAKSEERTKLAEQHASEANAKSESFRLDIAKANESAKQAEARAAEATLALERLKAPRTLSIEQQTRIREKLRKFAGQKFDFNVYPESEPMALATMFDAILKSAGWERIDSQSGAIVVTVAGSTAGTAYLNGVEVFVGPDNEDAIPVLAELASAISENGIPCIPHKLDELKGKTPKAILIAVGNKPQK
jgi:hypothetical protein